MKKILFFASALAGLLLAGSCQREELAPATEGNVVTFEVSVPEIATKALGDAVSNIDDLVYAVYWTEAESLEQLQDSPALQGSLNLLYKKNYTVNPFNGTGKTTVNVELLNDKNYIVLFWAQVSETWVAGDNFDLIRVSYPANMQANSNNYAAFSGVSFISKNNLSGKKDVTLKRPFAQLNIGTTLPNDKTGEEHNFDVTIEGTSVKVKNAGTSFNLIKQVAEGNATVDAPVTFAEAAAPTNPDRTDGKLVVNNTPYTYVAMNYVFANGNVEVDYVINLGNYHGTVKNTVSNVPVAANYRTNIIGNLLTSDVKYNVTLDDDWAGEYYGEPWVEIPPYNAETKTYTVTTDLQLLWIAQQVNSGAKTFEGETVQVAADIDLENILWSPIGTSTTVTFKGMFEGVSLTKSGETYPTISNFKIENGDKSGFFGVLCNGGKVRNLNFSNVTISGERQLGVVAGELYGNLETPTIENVTVENANITAIPVKTGDVYDNGDKVGGIAGLIGQNAYIKDCTVSNSTFKAYRDMGGIVGTTQYDYSSKIVGNTVKDLTFIVTSHFTPYADNSEAGHYAAIRGGRRSNAGDVIEDNTTENEPSVFVESSNGAAYDSVNKVYSVTAPEGLAVALSGAGAAGAGNHTINIACNLDMTNVEWTPINVDGYNGADIVTVNGNGNTINGLKAALFEGGFAGGSGIVINGLTIENAQMIATNTQGYGAFVNCADSMDEITLINCHLKNSTIITPNDGAAESRIGGLVGWTAGYNNQNDGPVDSYITIQNCSVTGCTLKGAGSIGGICGHAGANAATFTTIENCTVTGNTLVSTDDGDWRVGAIVGTANNGQCVINNVTASGNTISQVGKTAEVYQSELYGRFVPAGTGTLKINGNAVSTTTPVLVNGYTALYTADGEYFIYNLAGFQDLHTFFSERYKNPFDKVFNIAADIDAEGYTWASIWLETGNNNMKGSIINGNGHSIKNLTITGGAMFGGTPNGQYSDVPMTIKNLTIDSASVTEGPHFNAVFWGQTYGDVAFENVVVKNSEIGGNCNVGAFVGGTALDGTATAEISFKDCAVNGTTLTATGATNPDPTGASGFVGRAFGKTSLKFEGTNTIDEATTITNNNGLVGGRVYAYTTHIGGNWEGTGVCDTFTNWDGLDFVLVSEGLLKKQNTSEYYVSSAAGLETMNQMFADMSAGRYVVLNLNRDIDFTGKTWTPVDSHADTAFEIAEINGNGHTISNLTINGQAMFRRFAGTGDVVVKDITFDNATVNSNSKINTSILTVQSYQNILLDNVDVKNSSITGGYKVAPLIATVYNENASTTVTATLKDCDVENVEVKAVTYDFCTTGMVAFVNAGDNDAIAFENCTINNLKLIAPDDSYKAHAAIYTTGSGSLYNEADGVAVSNVTFETL